MLKNAKKLETAELRARDGGIGRIDDVLFDDRFWHVRYLVADTGVWLSGRRVLLSPVSIVGWDESSSCLAVNLTKEQVRASPDVDATNPVTREHEMRLHEHYRWAPYWGANITLGGDVMPEALPAVPPPPLREPAEREAKHDAEEDGAGTALDDPHLRSARHVRGYRIAATDGELGHVEDFLIDPQSWQIRFLVVDTRNWWPGRKVVLAPLWLQRVGWTEAKVYVDLTREAIKASPSYDPDRPILHDYADQLHRHYHRRT